MQALVDLCNGPLENLPKRPLHSNRCSSTPSSHNLLVYNRLRSQSGRVFTEEDEANLEFLELFSASQGKSENSPHNQSKDWRQPSNSVPGFQAIPVKSQVQLRTHFGLTQNGASSDPQCRFLSVIQTTYNDRLLMLASFLESLRGSSRERLRATHDMLMLAFSFLDVTPDFFDYIFTFGHQSHVQEPFFSSFRQRTCLGPSRRALAIPELSRSGSEFEICYNLRSVEQNRAGSTEWRTRSCAVHHIFDTKNIRTSWIVIKGNSIIKDLIESATGANGESCPLLYQTLEGAYSASLAIHLIICHWAVQEWRWYVNHLDEQARRASKRTITAPVVLPSSPATPKSSFYLKPRTDTQKSNTSILAKIARTPTMLTEKMSISSPKPPPPAERTYTDPESGLSQPLPPHMTMKNSSDPTVKTAQPVLENSEDSDFSFAKLQRIQHLQEKANEAMLSIKLNIGVMRQIRQYYDGIVKSKHFPAIISQLCSDEIDHFSRQTDTFLEDLQSQVLRLQALVGLLEDRKTLVYRQIPVTRAARLSIDQLHSILEHQNTQINKLATKNMISMTEDMSNIARKTKIETVSMKVITVVTLFFLPGTFISVSLPLLARHPLTFLGCRPS